MTDLVDLWPLAGLRVRSGDLELRFLDDEHLLALARLAADGIHAPEAMPFTVPWTRGTPTEVARSILTYHWGRRAAVAPEAWQLELAVVRAGEVRRRAGAHREGLPGARARPRPARGWACGTTGRASAPACA